MPPVIMMPCMMTEEEGIEFAAGNLCTLAW